MEELKDRIKKARKDAGFKSQEKLAEFLGTSRDAIATYELGRVVPNDVFIQLMATKLNISEEWLRTGEGEMKSPKSESIVDELAAVHRLDERRKNLLKNFLSLKDEEQELIVNALEIMASISPQKNATDADSKHIDEVVDALTLSRADAIRLINAAYDRREKETLDAG